MTAEQLEARLNKLITYTKQLASQHNKLEEREALIEHALHKVPLGSMRKLADPKTFEVDE
jgi:hypothetical protein